MPPAFKFFLFLRLFPLVLLIAITFFSLLNITITSSLPVVQRSRTKITAGKPISRTDGCVVDPEAAKVHEENEIALIQYVNNDNTIQVQTVDTRIAILFEVTLDKLRCFRKGSIVPVTISKCKKNRKGECNFSLLHTVYVRTLPVKIIAWKYPTDRPKL